MAETIRILVADDHSLFRGAFAQLLSQEPGFAIVGTAADADQAVRMAAEHDPDVVLMDIDMPGLSCFDAARTIQALRPSVRVVFLSAHVKDCYVEQALQVQARGYLSKAEPPEAVIAAIREVASGGVSFSQEIRERLLIDATGVSLAGGSKSRASLLTSREVEVLQYIARGMSKKEIAGTMHLSVKTVDRHCANLMCKLDIHDRVELARYAFREGFAHV